MGYDPRFNYAFSYLPGQRLSRCTCPGESHPGPMHPDGTFVGRSAPEIDLFEAQVRMITLDSDPNQTSFSFSMQWALMAVGPIWSPNLVNLACVYPHACDPSSLHVTSSAI